MAISRLATASIVQGFQKNKSLLAGNDAVYSGSYESIETITVGATSVGSVTFSNIPQTYTHLQLRIAARGDSGTLDWGYFRANAALTGSSHYLVGTGTTTVASAYVNSGQPLSITFPGSTAATGIFSGNIIDIFDYTNTNKYKTGRVLGGTEASSVGRCEINSYLFSSTNAITSIQIVGWAVGSFVQNSTFALYGVK